MAIGRSGFGLHSRRRLLSCPPAAVPGAISATPAGVAALTAYLLTTGLGSPRSCSARRPTRRLGQPELPAATRRNVTGHGAPPMLKRPDRPWATAPRSVRVPAGTKRRRPDPRPGIAEAVPERSAGRHRDATPLHRGPVPPHRHRHHGGPGLVSGLVLLTTKLLPTIGLIALVLGAWLGLRGRYPRSGSDCAASTVRRSRDRCTAPVPSERRGPAEPQDGRESES